MKTYILNLIRKASTKGDNSCYSLFVFLQIEDFPKMGLTLKGKNLIFGEQISSLKCSPRLRREADMKMTELFPLREYLILIGSTANVVMEK